MKGSRSLAKRQQEMRERLALAKKWGCEYPAVRNPRTPQEWQACVDAAYALIAIDDCRMYGLVTGGPVVDRERASTLLEEGKRLGFTPAEDCVERMIAEVNCKPN